MRRCAAALFFTRWRCSLCCADVGTAAALSPSAHRLILFACADGELSDRKGRGVKDVAAQAVTGWPTGLT